MAMQPKPTGIRPEFEALITKFEQRWGVDFTAAEERRIAAAKDKPAEAKKIAASHHSGFQSRQGGKFGAGKVGAGYYRQKDGQK